MILCCFRKIRRNAMSKLGWQCSICTYQHHAPGNRCAMCGELRVSKQDMSNFILGTPIPIEHTTNSTATTTTRSPMTTTKQSSSIETKKPVISTNNNIKTPFSVAAAAATSKTDQAVAPSSVGHRTLRYEPGPVPFDPETAGTWVFPSSDVYEKRKYQFEISETAVLQNTLVSLPTGLGKTLIAAVVLYNYYRWFPTGKVLFLAPTVPLVDQQITACYEIMGIPAHDTAILTGKVPAKQRMEIYKSRRVFFCTPQTIQKDLENGRIDDPRSIVCVVLDEAHKAVGDYAYCKVVEQLEAAKAKFRLLGLSATPGTSIKAIQQVIYKLRINCIEARTDADVQKYIHDRQSEIVIVKQLSVIRNIQRRLDDILQPVLDRLRQAHALNMVGNATVTPYCLIRAKQAYEGRENYEPSNIGWFVAAIAFAQIRSDLHRHGLGVVRNKLLNWKNNRPRGIMASIVRSTKFDELCNEMEEASSNTDASGNQTHDRLKNNPKLESLRGILTEHFERRKACNSLNSTRAIVFSQFRDSVCEIQAALQDMALIRPRHFVGQGKGTDKMRGMKQEEQKRVIQEFRDGKHNVLVCTCIGEEGLDIGEVDLIVNFDCLSSPIRMIQRVGRTGRKRDGEYLEYPLSRMLKYFHSIGRVVTLVSEGSEERTLAKSKQNERNLVHALRNPRSFTVTPSVPTFPQPPTVEERDMRVSHNFRMSQVDGAKKRKMRLLGRKTVSSSSRRKWKLGNREVQRLEGLLGPWTFVHVENSQGGQLEKDQCSSSVLWPIQLRKRLFVGRTMSLGIRRRPKLFSSGLVVSMLRNFESDLSFNFQHRKSGKAIEQLFPLDAKQLEPELDSLVLVDSRIAGGDSSKHQITDQHVKAGSKIKATVAVDTPSLFWNAARETLTHPDVQREQAPAIPFIGLAGQAAKPRNPYIKYLSVKDKLPKIHQGEGSAVYQSSSGKVRNQLTNHEAIPALGGIPQKEDQVLHHAIGHSTETISKPTDLQNQEPDTANPVLGFHAKRILDVRPSTVDNNTFMRMGDSIASTELPCGVLEDFRLPSQDNSSVKPNERFQQDVFDEFQLPSQDSSSCSEVQEYPERAACGAQSESNDKDDHDKAAEIRNLSVAISGPADEGGFVLPTPESSSDEESINDAKPPQSPLAATTSFSNHVKCSDRFDPQANISIDFDTGADRSKMERSAKAALVCTTKTSLEHESQQSQEIIHRKRRKVLAIEDTPESSASIHARGSSGYGADELSRKSSSLPVCTRNSQDATLSCTPKEPDSVFKFETPACEILSATLKSALAIDDTPEDQSGTFVRNQASTGLTNTQENDDVDPETAICAVCMSNTLSDENILILCDGFGGQCNLAVHVTCYSANVTSFETKWYCDPCSFRRKGMQIRCAACGTSKGALKRRPSGSWACVLCPQGAQEKPESRLARRQYSDFNPSDEYLDEEMLKTRREKNMEKYFVKEADAPSDMTSDDDSGVLKAIEEEEAGNAFINDSSQLGYTQDDVVESKGDVEGHVALDAERERMRRFDTPLLNRRMRKNRQTWQASPLSERSNRGLGKMHFIRSVIEHHRQGGNSEDIEAVYRELEAEADASIGSDNYF